MIKQEIRDSKGGTRIVKLNPLKSIRAFCLECVCWSDNEVKQCSSPLCALYQFRFGTNPSHKKKLTDEQREGLRNRLKKTKQAT